MSAVLAAPGRPPAEEQHHLTTFENPFDEEEADNSSYALVSSLLSKVKNTFTSASTQQAPVGAVPSTPVTPLSPSVSNNAPEPAKLPPPKPVHPRVQNVRERPTAALAATRRPAPPLISMTPAISELPSYLYESDTPKSKSGELANLSIVDHEASTSIPGFPIQDDTRSIRTSNSLKRFGSASKLIRRLRGDGLSKDYWMDDDLCKECYDCKSTFTTWRRKHHCRICGQIYCSRCASNIIKGSRFGQDGVVRVCNICLQMLEDDNYDDDDDRRSVASMQSSAFSPHQLESVQSSYLGSHSPFSAQTLLSHSYDANPYALPESASHRRMSSNALKANDGNASVEADDSSAVAPFRRNADDEKESGPGPNADEAIEQYLSDTETKSPTVRFGPGHSTRPSVSIEFPTIHEPKESFINFPGSSSPDGADSPKPLRSRVSSFATDVDALTPPFLRSRVPSRLTGLEAGEPGWRTRRESSAYAAELNAMSMFHLRIMLRQLLTKAEVPRVKEWEETLLRLSLRVTSHLALNPRAPGASMDVRSYVKIKKIPGGTPRDSECVDGAVITKNVAHKNMVRDIRNPRVMLVSFPFDYHRVEGQFMPFDPLLAQEKDYLYNLVSRVSALRPHIVLVEKSVSRLALDYLLKANIAVARTVKNTAIQFVARATQAQVLTSMDRLVMERQMGHCARFRLQTFEHTLIPGLRKTYMRFEGCSPDTACTIVLRGEDVATLKRIKAVTSFIMFIVRNLKMETFLWKDTIISMPMMTTEAAPPLYCESNLLLGDLQHTSSASISKAHSDLSSSNVETSSESARRELSRRIQDSIQPYLANFISASATLRFPPPYALWRMKELDDRVRIIQKDWEGVETVAILSEETGERGLFQQQSFHVPSGQSTMDFSDVEENPNTPLARVVSLPPAGTNDSVQDQDRSLKRSVSHSSLASRASSVSSSILKPIAPAVDSFGAPALPGLRLFSEIARESALHEAKFGYAEQLRIWEWYLRKNADDFIVQKYQCIYVRHFVIPTLAMELEPSCHMPKLTRICYYGNNDCTLSQFIEDTIIEALDGRKVCGGKGCHRPLLAHSKVYVHHESRVVIAAEPWIPASSSEASALTPDKIASFSVCRVCLQTTPFIPLSDEALKYSFGKFLELHFYPADVQLIHGAGCEHNVYLHHIRYFAWHGMTVRFQTDTVDIYEVVLPPMRTVVHMKTSFELKNRDYESLLARNTSYWRSVIERVVQLQLQGKSGSPQDKSGAIAAEVAGELLQRVEADRAEIARTIQRTYTESPPTDTLALGAVRSLIQNKVVEWDLKLEQFEKTYTTPRTRFISEKDIRRMTGSHHFKRIYDDFFRQYTSSASEADEKSDTRTDEPESSVYSEPESMDEKRPLPVFSGDQSAIPAVAELFCTPPSASSEDGDSDSTISAHTRPPDASEVRDVVTGDRVVVAGASLLQSRTESRLPRWQGGTKTSVAELVKQFQPMPPGNESAASGDEAIHDIEVIAPLEPRRRTKSSASKSRPPHDSAISDFERSYAANVGPRHLTSRRSSGKVVRPALGSRIPAPRHRTGYSRGYADTAAKGADNPSSSSKRQVSPSEEFPEEDDVGDAPLAKGKVPVRRGSRVPPRPAYHKGSVRPVPLSSTSKVSSLARQFERMSKDSERATRRYAVLKRKARPVAVANAKVKAFSDIKDMRAVVLDGSDDSSDSSSEADDEDDSDDDTGRLESSDPSVSQPNATSTSEISPTEESSDRDHSVPVTPTTPGHILQELPELPTSETSGNDTQDVRTSSDNTADPALSEHSAPDEQLPPYSDISSTEGTSSMIGTVSAWWRSAQGAVPLQYPFSSAEHVFVDNSITIREDEPTSIIAFTLNSKDHRQAMNRAKSDRMTNSLDNSEIFMPDDSSDSRSNWGLINLDDAPDPADLLKHTSHNVTHLSFQFESGSVTISCVVFCAEQFDALRRTCQCDRTLIESLARCLKWDASGGKSGSAFLKTRDDRFIAKELTKSELDSMINFAPSYFDYMTNAVASKRPTLLAKIFGVYKIAYKNPILGKVVRMNLLVMENLFYGRRFTRIYDLKGSMRNRRVQSTGRPNEVLLDENLDQSAHLLPFYLREHSKRIMRGALWNDSKFLAQLNIMDYSLLVAVDSENNDLIVGIVDYIRTYTWDKRLESWVKESTFLGGGPQREPTIVTPKQYKARFRAAMERYLPLVPDRWTKIDDAPDNEGDNLLEMWPDW